MPLSTYAIPYEDVPLPKQRMSPEVRAKLDAGEIDEQEAEATRVSSFAVRGLALPDITYLVTHHLGDLVKAVDLYQERKGMARWNKTSLTTFATIIARDFPLLTAEIVSVCADEEGQLDKIMKLPFLVQINAMLIVCKLTMEEAGGLKNLSAFAAPLLAGLDGEADPGTLKRKLLDFITGSGETLTS